MKWSFSTDTCTEYRSGDNFSLECFAFAGTLDKEFPFQIAMNAKYTHFW